MSPPNTEETLAVVADLQQVYAAREDADTVSAIQKTHGEILELVAAREQQMIDIIRGLAKQVKEAEIRATPPKPETAHKERVDAIQEAARVAWTNIDQLQQQKQELEQYFEGLKEQAGSLEGRRRQIENLAKQEMPRVFKEIAVYADISNIAWDYEAEGHVKGYIPKPKEGDILHFDFNPRRDSQFTIVNTLWDMMGS